MIPPLYGLVLAGGRSRRMGRDKAALAYRDGVPHARRTADLLSGFCERVFVSVRADQAANDDPALAGIEKIPDSFDVGGPLNGILSAQAAYPDAAFLVAACDLPFLSAEALAALVAGRDPSKPMTAFENPARENFLEPLCAIYEPGYSEQAQFVMNLGLTCPTKIADALDTHRLQPDNALFLENANSPEDYERAVASIHHPGHRVSAGGGSIEVPGRHGSTGSPHRSATEGAVTVEYFAVFRAQAKAASEAYPWKGESLSEVYDALRSRHGFALERASVHVAVNDVYASWDASLKPGDRLVFIPPVSGG